MNILAFDTSSRVLSAAVLSDQTLLAETSIHITKNHSSNLMPAIDFLVRSVGWSPADLDRIAVAQGPGSYTGLRVAAATAKTLAYTLKIDLVGVSSLAALALNAQASGLVIPLMDARRNNVYAGFYENGRATEPDRHAAFEAVLDQLEGRSSIIFAGELANFSQEIAQRFPRAQQLPVAPSAYEIGKLGSQLEPVDPHTFVPRYLKRVEAEENWLRHQTDSPVGDYIRRV